MPVILLQIDARDNATAAIGRTAASIQRATDASTRPMAGTGYQQWGRRHGERCPGRLSGGPCEGVHACGTSACRWSAGARLCR